jgi:hypothetical protein
VSLVKSLGRAAEDSKSRPAALDSLAKLHHIMGPRFQVRLASFSRVALESVHHKHRWSSSHSLKRQLQKSDYEHMGRAVGLCDKKEGPRIRLYIPILPELPWVPDQELTLRPICMMQVMLSASASVAVKQAVAERLEKPSRPSTSQKTANTDSRPMGVVGTQAPSSRRVSKDRTYSELSGSFRSSDADSLDGTGAWGRKLGSGRKAPRTPDIHERARGGADLDVGASSSPGSLRKGEPPTITSASGLGGSDSPVASPGISTPFRNKGSEQGRAETGQGVHGLKVAHSLKADDDPIRDTRSRSLLIATGSQDPELWDGAVPGRSALDPDRLAGGQRLQMEVLPMGEALPNDLNDFSFSLPSTPSQPMALDPEAGREADERIQSLLYDLPVTTSAASKRTEGKLLLLKERQKRGVVVSHSPMLCLRSVFWSFVRHLW